MTEAPILAVRNLASRLGGGLKLFDVSLEVRRGEMVAILGANGAGKSTLLGLIAGLFAPSSGSILLQGRDITGMPAHRIVRQGIALAPQNHPIFESLTVEENLSIGATVADEIDLLDLSPSRGEADRAGRPVERRRTPDAEHGASYADKT